MAWHVFNIMTAVIWLIAVAIILIEVSTGYPLSQTARFMFWVALLNTTVSWTKDGIIGICAIVERPRRESAR